MNQFGSLDHWVKVSERIGKYFTREVVLICGSDLEPLNECFAFY